MDVLHHSRSVGEVVRFPLHHFPLSGERVWGSLGGFSAWRRVGTDDCECVYVFCAEFYGVRLSVGNRVFVCSQEGDRRWYRRREWIFGLVTLALRRRSPEGAAAAPASDVEPPQDSATEGKEGVAGAEESLETRSDVQTPGVPEADTDSAACTGAVSAPDPGELEMLALLLSTRLAQTPSPHTGSPAHLISRIAGVCVSFLSDCCSAPECPTQEPFEGPA